MATVAGGGAAETIQLNYQNGSATCIVGYLGNVCQTNPILFKTPFKTSQRIAEHCFFNISTSYNNDLILVPAYVTLLDTTTSWTGGMPVAKTELFGNSQHRFLEGSNNLREVGALSFTVNVVTISSSITAILLLQWSTDQTTWNDLLGVNVNIHTTGMKVSPPNNLPVSAYAGGGNLYFRIAGQNGAGVADIPQFSMLYLSLISNAFATTAMASPISNTQFTCVTLTGFNANNDTTPVFMDWEAYACLDNSLSC
jgi:hypothetical protein